MTKIKSKINLSFFVIVNEKRLQGEIRKTNEKKVFSLKKDQSNR